MSWQHLISGVRDKHRQHKADKAAAHTRDRELRNAIEHVVDEINPRIRGLNTYRKKLRPCVERALDYCSELVIHVPESIEVSSKTWGKEPTVKALFSGAEDLRRVFSRSREVRDFFDQHTSAGCCYALLSMEHRERTVLGMEMHGDVIKRDVKQVAVSFTDHRLVKPSSSEPELKTSLRQRAFETLISCALERITELVAARQLMEEEQQLREMQLKITALKNKSLGPLIGDEGDASSNIQASRKQSPGEAGTRLTTLEDYIDRISDVLGNPQSHLRLSQLSIRLSNMNIKLDKQSTDTGHVLELNEVYLGEHQKRILMIIRFPRDDLLPKQDFLAHTPRYQ